MAGSYELVYRVSRGRKGPDDANVRINVSPPSYRHNWPLVSSLIFLFFPTLLENYIYKYFKQGGKEWGGGKNVSLLEKSLSRNIFSDSIVCVCVCVTLTRESLRYHESVGFNQFIPHRSIKRNDRKHFSLRSRAEKDAFNVHKIYNSFLDICTWNTRKFGSEEKNDRG